MLEDLKRRIKKHSLRLRHKKSKQALIARPKPRFLVFLSEIEDQSFETELISCSNNEPQRCAEEIAIDLQQIDSELNAIVDSPWNYNGKCSQYFQRQLTQQEKDLVMRKEQLRERFGEIETEYSHMQIQMPGESSKTQSTTSNYYSEKRQYNLINRNTHQKLRLTFIDQDFDKLLPGNDLNDTLIQNYLHIVNTFMLAPQDNKSSYIFSTYLIEKLLKEMLANNENDALYFYSEEAVSNARRSVQENYGRVQRWTRKQDLFGYEVLVFPINMFVHWFCVLVLNPGSLINASQDSSQSCEIIFCDSMFQQRSFVVEAIRTYLQLQLFDKKKISIRIDESNAPSYQLLLPRQTNTHDCGLYMLAYIEELLINRRRHLEGLNDICNRLQLRLFPRIYLESFRHRMMNLLVKLYKEQAPERTEVIIDQYLTQRSNLFAASSKTDSESMQTKQFQKFIALVRPNNGVELSVEDQYSLLVKFNLICEINYYQFDNVRQPREREETDSDFM